MMSDDRVEAVFRAIEKYQSRTLFATLHGVRISLLAARATIHSHKNNITNKQKTQHDEQTPDVTSLP